MKIGVARRVRYYSRSASSLDSSVAKIRDLRTQFPKLKEFVVRAGEVIVSEKAVDYFARLKRRQPRPLSSAKARALDEANRGEC